MRISDEAFRSTPAVSSTQIRQMRLKESAPSPKRNGRERSERRKNQPFSLFVPVAPGLGR